MPKGYIYTKADGKVSDRMKNQYFAKYESLSQAKPTDILFEPVNACNHRCLFCARDISTRKRHTLDLELAVSLLEQAYAMGVRSAGFYGCGEPFLVPNLADMVRAAMHMGYNYTYVTTNGALATSDRVKRVIEAGLSSLKFSINAGTRETYREVHGRDDFQKVLGNLRFVAEYNAKHLNGKLLLSVSMVNSSKSDDEIDTLRALVEPYVNEFLVYGMNDQAGYKDNCELKGRVKSRPRKAPCSMVFNRIHVTPEGYLSACCEDFQNYLVIADLREMPLEKAWCSSLFVDLRNRHLHGGLDATLCHYCLTGESANIHSLVERYCTPFDFQAIRKRLKRNA